MRVWGCALALAAVLGTGSAGQGGDIVLGMSAAFTGPSARLGGDLYRGAQAHFLELNAEGGVLGRRIRLRAYDDGYEPIRAIRNTIRLIEEDGVPLLFGYVGTPTVTRALPLIKRYGDRAPYLLFPFTGAQPQREPPYSDYVFNLRASYLEETAGLVDNFIRVGRRRIAILYQADAYGRSGWDGVRRALGEHGLKIVAEATYRRGTPYPDSMRAQVDALRAGTPDAIIVIGAYAASAAFVRDAVDGGLDVPIANVSFVGSESMLELLEEERRRTRRAYTAALINSQVVPSYEDLTLPAVNEYRALFRKHRPALPDGEAESGDAPPFSFISFEGFLNARLLTEALRRSGGQVDRASIGRAFAGIDGYDMGIDGTVSFAFGRNQGLNQVYYTRVEDGRFVPVDSWQRWAK